MESTNAKKGKGGLIIAAIAVVLVIIIAVVVVMLQPKKINLEEMVTITCNGYDGYGTARASLDRDTLYEELATAKGGKEADEDDLLELFEEWAKLEDCISDIELELDKTEEISNGDKLTVEITYDNEKAKEHGVKFVGSKVTIEAEGLEPIKEINPFDDLEVTFSGIAPYGTMEYTYSGDATYVNTYSFVVDKRNNLRNGDKVKVSLEMTDEQTVRYGYIITQKEQEYEVSGLEEYVEAYADLSADFLATLKTEAQDILLAYAANSYMDTVNLGELSYAGYVFNVQKPDATNYWGNYNNLYIIYTAMISDSENKFSNYNVYYPVQFNDIISKDGEFSFDPDKDIVGYSSLGDTWYATDGYINPLIGYKELVTAQLETYKTEAGDGFEKFDEDGYITGLADISSEYRSELAADAKDVVENYFVTGYADTTRVEGLTLLGEYLLMAKNQGSDYVKNNKYILVYSATVSSTEGNFETSTVYYPVEYDGIISLPDNQYICMAERGIQGGTVYFPDTWYYTYGYLDGTTMYQKLVTANRADYTYEMTDGLKQFGE